nr:hypothetical protein GCM10020241_61510 [Streptoalloteichus tenebrarius]
MFVILFFLLPQRWGWNGRDIRPATAWRAGRTGVEERGAWARESASDLLGSGFAVWRELRHIAPCGVPYHVRYGVR